MSTVSEILFTPLGVGLRLFALLLVPGQLFRLLTALRLRRSWTVVALSASQLLLGAALLTLLLDGAYQLDYLSYPRAYLPEVLLFGELPWPVIAAAELLLLAALGLSVWRDLRYESGHPNAHSIKRAVDLLPTGVGVAGPDGTILLSNLVMHTLSRALTGSAYSDCNTVLRAARQQGEAQGESLLLRMPNGAAYLLRQMELELGGRPYTQLTAEDVTEQYRITAELEQKNIRLRALQQRMRAYQKHQTELVAQQELLSARTAIHNQLGGALLTGKYHLEHPESTDPETLRLMLWQINTYLLSEVDDPEPRADALTSALAVAEGIGVTVQLRGAVSERGPVRELLAQAVEECAANTVKHAHGDRLEVLAAEDGFTVTGSGTPPTEEITPTGGLRSLQLAAEQAGGRMELRSRPAVAVTVRLGPAEPKK